MPGRAYRLLYGNLAAGRPPQYALSRFLDAGAPKPVYLVTALGPEELTRNYVDPRPFAEPPPCNSVDCPWDRHRAPRLLSIARPARREHGRACQGGLIG